MRPVLRDREERVDAADGERADDGAPQAREAANDEHRERHEREVEIDALRRDRERVDDQAAREPGHRSREREGDEPLAVDRDADGPRGCRVLARRA
jgi:hypothetical protein